MYPASAAPWPSFRRSTAMWVSTVRQVVPTVLAEMMSNPDKEKAGRAMEALLQMKKLDIAELKRAYEGKGALAR